MVLCKFYQQGHCRFGSKCINDHVDIKQIIKIDIESAIKGKQWPFSCYGPFKDKPIIPNFIEDQSFEEIRWLCYDAKQKNYFEQFNQQFQKEAAEATKKMQTLLQCTPEVCDVLTQIYDTPDNNAVNVETNNKNPFGLVTGGGAPVAQSGNLFATAPSSGASIFGNSTSFATAKQQPQNSIFGGQLPQPTNSIFGGVTQTSVFGQPQTNVASGGLFAQAGTTQQQPSTNIFAQAGTTQQQPSTNIFSQSPQQQQTSITGSLFSQPSQQQQPQSANNFTLFGQIAQQTAPAFQQQAASTFTQHTPFAQTAQQPAQQQQQSAGIFGGMSNMQQTGTNLFTNSTLSQQNLFGQQAPASNIFSQQQAQIQPAQNFFQQAMQQPSSTQQEQNQNQQQSFMQQQQSQLADAAPMQSSSIYSEMANLTIDEIEAFKADSFLPGKIPLKPPPRELIN